MKTLLQTRDLRKTYKIGRQAEVRQIPPWSVYLTLPSPRERVLKEAKLKSSSLERMSEGFAV